jgi:hypothetical protein
MQNEDLIAISEFCIHYNAEISFIHSLREYGLIETTIIENSVFIPKEQLPQLEKFTRLHYDMDINLQGIEAINNLLQRVHDLQIEITQLKNKLH